MYNKQIFENIQRRNTIHILSIDLKNPENSNNSFSYRFEAIKSSCLRPNRNGKQKTVPIAQTLT